MKKLMLNLVVLGAALFVTALLLHAVALITESGQPHTGLASTALNAGQLHRMVTHKAFWRSFPSMPNMGLLLHLPSALVTAFILGHGIYLWGVRKQLSPLPFGLVIWTYGLVPYGLGLWFLQDNGVVPQPYNIWMMMLLGLLASSVTCGLSILLGIFKIDVFQAMTRVPLPQVRFKTQPVAES